MLKNEMILKNYAYELFDMFEEAYWSFEKDSKKMMFSQQFYLLTGYQEGEINDIDTFFEIVYPTDRKRFDSMFKDAEMKKESFDSLEFRIICNNGTVKWVNSKIKSISVGTERRSVYIGTVSDIDAIKKNSMVFKSNKYYDGLTNLPNNLMLEYKLESVIQAAKLHSNGFFLLSVSISNLKKINEVYGIWYGYEIVKFIGNLLVNYLNNEGLLFRFNEDEYYILFNENIDRLYVDDFIQKLLEYFKNPIFYENKNIPVIINVGVTMFPQDGSTVDELINNVKLSIDAARESGGNSYSYFQNSMRNNIIKRIETENLIRKAIKNDGLFVMYQPQISPQNGELIGLEALVRIKDIHGRTIPPGDFIPIAEENGLVVSIGEIVIEKVCMQIREWQLDEYEVPPIAINVSAAQFKKESFLRDLERVMRAYKIEPDMVEIEITEGVFIDSATDILNIFHSIKDMGMRIALDDFGTGYSSLNYIKNFPLNRLKIDRAFVKDLETKTSERAIAKTIVDLAHILDCDVIAEGVETEVQFKYLQEIGCDAIQGYYVSKPKEVTEVIEFFKSKS